MTRSTRSRLPRTWSRTRSTKSRTRSTRSRTRSTRSRDKDNYKVKVAKDKVKDKDKDKVKDMGIFPWVHGSVSNPYPPVRPFVNIAVIDIVAFTICLKS